MDIIWKVNTYNIASHTIESSKQYQGMEGTELSRHEQDGFIYVVLGFGRGEGIHIFDLRDLKLVMVCGGIDKLNYPGEQTWD